MAYTNSIKKSIQVEESKPSTSMEKSIKSKCFTKKVS